MKRFQSHTFSSQFKKQPPIQLDQKLAYMSQALEELQESLVQEITVTDNLEQTNSKVRNNQNFQIHSRQILALKAAVEGLNNSILGQLDLLYNDVKAYANREIINLLPKIESNSTKCEILEMNSNKNNGDIISLRREINDRYDYMSNRLDNLCSELKEIREKQHFNKDEIEILKEDVKRINEKFVNSSEETYSNLKRINENLKDIFGNFENIEKKIEKNFGFLNNEIKKNSDVVKHKLKDYDEKCQEQLIRLRSNIDENMKDIEGINQRISENSEKLNEFKSEFNFKHDDLFENFNSQLKKHIISVSSLSEKIEKISESSQLSLEEINKSFSQRLESLSKTFLNENKGTAERIYKIEKELDIFHREVKNALNNFERGLIIQDEKLSLSLGSKKY